MNTHEFRQAAYANGWRNQIAAEGKRPCGNGWQNLRGLTPEQLAAYNGANTGTLAAEEPGLVVVYIGRQAIVILPTKDVDLGEVAEDELIITRRLLNGFEYDAVKLKSDDPSVT